MKPKPPSTCALLTRALLHRCNDVFQLPRYTPQGWWECDVFELTASGYFREYEIKTTRQDFFDDRQKFQRLWGPPWGRVEYKHALLNAGSPKGPVQFWFVTPPNLVTLSEIPRWAGWLTMAPGQWNPVTAKRAPRLHTTKADPKVVQAAKDVCYGRYHALRRTLYP